MNRCYGCFEQIADVNTVCPHCGFFFRQNTEHKWILKPGTLSNGKYLIGKTLGEGGFGITYLAWDVNMETKVAIKEYYPGYLVSRDVTSGDGNYVTVTSRSGQRDFQDGLKRYVKEAAALSKFFDLPGIVSVKDFYYENETAYIVMEYIDGISLKALLERNGNRLAAEQALELMKPVISSLAVIHKNKLIHRDISPDNIMVDRTGKVKLIDFGAARSFEEEEKSMTVMLKHGYAPIEQYSRKGEQAATTDIYALCAVLYRMITGEVPTESTQRVRNDELVSVRHLADKTPHHIATAIEKGLSLMPEDRQQSMEELYADLYGSKSSRVSKQASNWFVRMLKRAGNALIRLLGKILKKIAVAAIIGLVLAVVAFFLYRANSDKIATFKNDIENAIGIKTTEMIEDTIREVTGDELNFDTQDLIETESSDMENESEKEPVNNTNTEESIESNTEDSSVGGKVKNAVGDAVSDALGEDMGQTVKEADNIVDWFENVMDEYIIDEVESIIGE